MNPWWKRSDEEDQPDDVAAALQATPEEPKDDTTESGATPATETATASEARADEPSDADGHDEAADKSRTSSRSRSTTTQSLATTGDEEPVSSELKADDPAGDEATKPRPRRRTARKRPAAKTTSTDPVAREDRESVKVDDREEAAPKRPARRRSRARKAPEPAPAPAATAETAATTPAVSELRELLQLLTGTSDPSPSIADERKIALFFDFENIALGIKDSEVPKFEVHLVLERLLEKGKIIVKKAYADWERYSEYKKTLHSAAIELIDIPQKYYSGKNSADIKLVVDAMELSASKEHLDTFVIISGDSDFSPLVSKLKENDKHVIGVGVKNSSSKLLIDNCDEFIYYEDIWRDSQQAPKLEGLDKKSSEVFSLMTESIQALIRENKDVLWGSMIKQTMQRKRPSFNEGYFGYRSFSELLEDAKAHNLIDLKKDSRSGSYIVTGFSGRR